MQRWQMPNRCPVCGTEMLVTRMHCTRCDTAVEGSFQVHRLARLSPEQQDFVERFLRVRGNIKELERELGISYPTVRARIDSILETMGYAADPDAAAGETQLRRRRREILEALDRGELTSQEAKEQLCSLAEDHTRKGR